MEPFSGLEEGRCLFTWQAVYLWSHALVSRVLSVPRRWRDELCPVSSGKEREEREKSVQCSVISDQCPEPRIRCMLPFDRVRWRILRETKKKNSSVCHFKLKNDPVPLCMAVSFLFQCEEKEEREKENQSCLQQ